MKTYRPVAEATLLFSAVAIILVAGGCGGGGGNSTDSAGTTSIALVGQPPVAIPVTKSLGPDGGAVDLTGVATVTVPAGTFAGPANITVQATADPATDDVFQATASAAPTTHRAAYEIRVNVGNSQPNTGTVQTKLTIPDGLLSVAGDPSKITAFVRDTVAEPDEARDDFVLSDATVDASQKTITVQLPPDAFSNALTADGSYEAQVVLGALSQSARSISRMPGSRPVDTDPDTDPLLGHKMLVDKTFGTPFASAPLGAPLVITSRFGFRESTNQTRAQRKPHTGVDLRAADGTPVLAAADGYVEQVTLMAQFPPKKQANGNFIRIRHPDGSTTQYLHLSSFSPRFTPSKKTYKGPVGAGVVHAGEEIGRSGHSSSDTISPHLHFVYKDPSGWFVNPEPFLPASNQDLPSLVSEFTFKDEDKEIKTDDETTLTAGNTKTLMLVARDSTFRTVATPPDAELNATADDSSVVKASVSGGALLLKGLKAGHTNVKVEYTSSTQNLTQNLVDPNKKKAYGRIKATVTGTGIDHIDITPANPIVDVDKTVQLTATPKDKSGNPIPSDNFQYEWKSSATSVATVDASGNVTGVTSGSATISVVEKISGKSASVTVTVSGLISGQWTGTVTGLPPLSGPLVVPLQMTLTATSGGTVRAHMTWGPYPNGFVASFSGSGQLNGSSLSLLSDDRETIWSLTVSSESITGTLAVAPGVGNTAGIPQERMDATRQP